MADKVKIEVEARFNDQVTGKTKSADDSIKKLGKTADQTQKKLDDLGKNTRKVIIDGSADKLVKKLDNLDKKVKNLTKGKLSIKLGADDKATSVINKITTKAKSFAGKTYRGILAIKDSGTLNTINKVNNAVRNLTGKTWQTVVTIKDMATAPLTAIKNQLFSIKSLVLAITAGWAANQFIANPVQTADAYTGAQIGFSTLLGDSAGQQMMDDLDQFAKETPFGTTEVISNTQKMIAMGWDAKNIIDDMKIIGDAAAATGKGTQGLEQIVLALAQIQTKGKVSAEELNQLAEAGISAKKYLAEGLGYGGDDAGMAKMYKELENGNVYAQEGLAAIMEGMKEFDGMMDATANETVEGLISQLSDAFEISVKRRWGQGLQDGLKEALGSAVDLTNTAEDGLNSLGDMLYELGSKASNFVADKFANAVERVNKITDTFEFDNASLGEKFKMLWEGVISDPFGDWWDKNKSKFATKAGEIGEDMGVMLSNGIKGLLGITDVFDDTNLSESGGASIAQSFAKGFVDGFDVSGIGAKALEAISNIWNALPAWGKVLVGGYVGGKALSGVGSMIGGVASGVGGLASLFGGAKGLVGSTGNAMVGGSGMLGGLASAGYSLTGGAAGSAIGGGTAALIGGGTIAGALVGGAAAIKGGVDLYGATKALKAGDITEAQAKGASGASALGGAATGAAIGTIIAPGIGTAIGAGIGGLAGWLGGNKIADNIRTAKVESEGLKEAIEDSNKSADELAETFKKGVWENMKKNMGDIKLTANEISRIADQIVWGKDLDAFDTFKQAKTQAEAAVKTLNDYGAATDKWMWKAKLGVKFNDDEIESIVEQFDGYIESAQNLVESKHYEFTAAVDMLLDEKAGKSIIESGDAFYTKLQSQLDKLGSQLSNKVQIALKDGVITLDEQKEITNLQKQIADITNKVSDAQASAEMDLIKLKFGKGTLDMDSFNGLMEQMQATIDERMTSSDEAFTVALSGLKLQLADGALSKSEYDKQVKTLVEGYKTTIDKVKAEVMGVEIDIIASSGYGEMLGSGAKTKLQKAIESALKTDIDPIEWTTDDVRKILGVDSLSEEAAGALGQMMSSIYQQLEALDISDAVDQSIGDTYFKDLLIEIDPDPRIMKQVELTAEEFGIPESKSAAVALLLTGDKKLLNKIDVSKLATEFGIPESQAKKVIEKLKGEKQIEGRITVLAEDFGIPDTISKTITVAISAAKTFVGNAWSTITGKARGGLVGMDIPGYASGGITNSHGPQLAMVAEEGPEMIIPLSSQRRNRALKLWAMAGHMMDVPGFARGGMTGGGQDEGIRFSNISGTTSAPSGGTQVDVGGISVTIQVDASGGQNISQAIQEQGEEIAETVAGILADALQVQFENTPTLGGA